MDHVVLSRINKKDKHLETLGKMQERNENLKILKMLRGRSKKFNYKEMRWREDSG